MRFLNLVLAATVLGASGCNAVVVEPGGGPAPSPRNPSGTPDAGSFALVGNPAGFGPSHECGLDTTLTDPNDVVVLVSSETITCNAPDAYGLENAAPRPAWELCIVMPGSSFQTSKVIVPSAKVYMSFDESTTCHGIPCGGGIVLGATLEIQHIADDSVDFTLSKTHDVFGAGGPLCLDGVCAVDAEGSHHALRCH